MNTLHEPLRHTIDQVDRALRRPIRQMPSFTGIQQALDHLERFYAQARQTPDAAYLIAAGCRLSCDLNEAIIEKLVDRLQAQDEAIQQLSKQLREQLQAHHQATRLLERAQALKQETVETSETVGLGLIL